MRTLLNKRSVEFHSTKQEPFYLDKIRPPQMISLAPNSGPVSRLSYQRRYERRHSSFLISRRRSAPELAQILTSVDVDVDAVDTITYAGIALISATVGFSTAKYLQRRDRVNSIEPEVERTVTQTETSAEIAVIPSPGQIWTDVKDKIQLIPETAPQPIKKQSIGVKNRTGSNRRKLWSHFRLGLQSLTVPARQQILVLAFLELQRNIHSVPVPALSSKEEDLESFVFQVILLSYSSAGEKWLGAKPVYYLDMEEDEEDEDERERCHEGFWKIIEEKLPVYTVLLKYLRFPHEEPEVDLEMINVQKMVTNKETEAVASPAVEGGGLCLKFRSRDSHLLTSSVQILEDLVLVVAELVALEYLRCLTQGNVKAHLVSDWPMSLKSNLRNTRTLERYRNQVFFGWWLYRNFVSVTAKFEDYHYLWGVQQGGNFTQRRCFVRRSEELAGLSGWGLSFSYFLEALDALEPICKTVLKKLGDLISFLLTQLIGRSVGLIIKGIQSSITNPWNNKPKPTSL
eukprot:g1651.t1